jgi:hypothetical protein
MPIVNLVIEPEQLTRTLLFREIFAGSIDSTYIISHAIHAET